MAKKTTKELQKLALDTVAAHLAKTEGTTLGAARAKLLKAKAQAEA